MQERIEADLKTAMLAGDKIKAETLRVIKSTLQNAAIELRAKGQEMSDEAGIKIMSSEAKKRAEAAELYEKAGESERASKELAEKTIIEAYLPEQMGDYELSRLIEKHLTALGAVSPADMGKVIGAVKAEAGASADGAVIARLVKEKLSP